MTREIPRLRPRRFPTTEEEIPQGFIPKRRPASVDKKADQAYQEAMRESLAKGKSYPQAAKAALKAFTKVIHDYDRDHSST